MPPPPRPPWRAARAPVLPARRVVPRADGGPTRPATREVRVAEEDAATLGAVAKAVELAVASPLFYVTAGIGMGVLLSSRFPGATNVVLFSAFPLVGLSVLARTPLGAQLEERAAAASAAYAGERARVDQARADAAVECASMYGPERTRWLPSALLRTLPSEWADPPHLDGTLPGDNGFDPLGLGRDAGDLARYRECELVHARWAMLAVPGCVAPEAVARIAPALADTIGEPVWWRVGAAKLNGADISWGGVDGFRIAGGIPIWGIALCQLVLMGGPEYARLVGIDSLEPVGVPLPGDANYPGGAPFDPLGLATGGVTGEEEDGEGAAARRRDAARGFVAQTTKELRVGRLAMLAMLGLFAQAAVTQQSPLDNVEAVLQR